MTDKARELLERAMNALDGGLLYRLDLQEKIRAYLAEPTQDEEPVAWGVKEKDGRRPWYLSDSKLICEGYASNYSHRTSDGPSHRVVPLFLHPAPRPDFVRLSDDEIRELWSKAEDAHVFARDIEILSSEKNK